jgi:hypothetical protein
MRATRRRPEEGKKWRLAEGEAAGAPPAKTDKDALGIERTLFGPPTPPAQAVIDQ